jgi:DNA-binding MarR family transcriptional regulator
MASDGILVSMETNGMAIDSRDLERDLGFLTNDVARLLRRGFDRRAQKRGITRAQWFVLAHLHRKDGQRQSDLAEELDMELAPLGKLLERLEAGGWVRRETDPHDRRVTRVYKTGKINPHMDILRAEAEALYAEAFVGLDDRERSSVIDLLFRLRVNLLNVEE